MCARIDLNRPLRLSNVVQYFEADCSKIEQLLRLHFQLNVVLSQITAGTHIALYKGHDAHISNRWPDLNGVPYVT